MTVGVGRLCGMDGVLLASLERQLGPSSRRGQGFRRTTLGLARSSTTQKLEEAHFSGQRSLSKLLFHLTDTRHLVIRQGTQCLPLLECNEIPRERSGGPRRAGLSVDGWSADGIGGCLWS